MAIKISGTTVVDNSRNITNANDANFAGIVTATNLVGDVTGNVVGNVTGTASTATVAVNAQGLTGTPNISVGTINASGTITGNGASITNIDAGNIATGIVTSARLGGGTASADTFLNGHGEFKEAGGGAWTYLAALTANYSSTLDFTNVFSSTYDYYVFMGANLIPSQQYSLGMKVITAGGVNSDQKYGYSTISSNENFPFSRSQSLNSQYSWSTYNGYGNSFTNTSYGGMSFNFYMPNPTSTTMNKYMYGQSVITTTAGSSYLDYPTTSSHNFVWSDSSTAVTGLQFFFASGATVNSGTIRLYGINNS